MERIFKWDGLLLCNELLHCYAKIDVTQYTSLYTTHNTQTTIHWSAYGDQLSRVEGYEQTKEKAALEAILYLKRRNPDFKNCWVSERLDNSMFSLLCYGQAEGVVSLVNEIWFGTTKWFHRTYDTMEDAMNDIEGQIKVVEAWRSKRENGETY